MRTWGRVNGVWTEVDTDSSGSNAAIWLTTLIQCLKLSLREDPLHADYGIPAQQSVITQLFPDFDVMKTQQQFAQYFQNLVITKVPKIGRPIYNVSVVLNNGVTISQQVPV
jgi:hypothetical protein